MAKVTTDMLISQFRLEADELIRISTGAKPGMGSGRYPAVAVATGGKNGAKVSAHQIVFLLAYGWMPPEVDHENGDKWDIRPSNLRAATHSQNMANRIVRKLDGLPRGVYRAWRKFQARVRVAGKIIHLGMFTDPVAASRVVEEKLQEVQGAFYKPPNPVGLR